MVIAQGEVCWADLPDLVGSGPGFRRPVLVVQGDAFNRSRVATVVCVPLTSNLKWAEAPGNVELPVKSTGLSKDSVANVSQVASLDRDVLTDRVGRVSKKQLDPDLLLDPADPAESPRWDEIPEVLRSCGYQRGGRDFQWEKQVGDVYVRLDLFRPQGTAAPSTPMTELPRGDRVLARALELRFRIGARDVKLKTPSPVDFVLMKLDAMRIRRPVSPKDAFDLYADVRKKTPAVVAKAIASAP